ncbi:hypothetical protein [Winogradskyella sp.]|uniref:hypothetical protein n=1 Tax=Winogradskyella sp. TaxID=1883156 RepID=UPI003F6B62C4
MKNIKLLPFLLLSMLMVLSCVDDDVQSLGGDLASTPYVVGFSDATTQARFLIDGTTQTLEVPLDLIGGNTYTNTPEIQVSYIIDPNSTAIQGTDYTVVDPNQTVTIDADRDFRMIELNVNTNNIDIDQSKTLILRLATPSIGLVADQFEEITIEIVGFCESDLSGAYTSNEIISAGAPNATITEVEPGVYRISSMPYIAFGGGAGPPAWIEFSEICGNVEWGAWQGGTLAEGSGTVNGNGEITFTSLTIYNNNVADPTDIWFDLGGCTYTPN